MTNNFDRILSDISTQSAILKKFQEGKTPDDVKADIIKVLTPYFYNKKNLEQLVILHLIGDVHTLATLIKTEYYPLFQECLNTFNRSKLLQPDICFEGMALFETEISEANGRFWSVYSFQKNLWELSDEDFLFECVDKIGAMCEGITKPFLKLLLFQVKITIGENQNLSRIQSMDLGQIVNELINDSGYPELFIPKPKKIRLKDWRNISYHHSATIKDSIITCEYGSKKNRIAIQLSKKELVETLKNIFLIFKTIKLAYKIFSIDNIYEIKKYEKLWGDSDSRKEIDFQNVILGMMSQGFEVKKFSFNNHDTIVEITDATEVNEKNIISRVAHASQFLIHFWLITKSENIKIQYQKQEPLFHISITGSDCKSLECGRIKNDEYIKRIKYIHLKTGQDF